MSKSDVVDQLKQISGIGAGRAGTLYSAGVRSVLDVSLLTEDALMEALSVSSTVATGIIESAQASVDADRESAVMDTSPIVGALPDVPVDDTAVDVPRGEKMAMMADKQKSPVRRPAGVLRNVLVCRECYTILAHPNPHIGDKRPRYGQLQPGMVNSGLKCVCTSRGSFNLGGHSAPGLEKKIADQPRNAIIFARFAV